jgi:hypothetical protein
MSLHRKETHGKKDTGQRLTVSSRRLRPSTLKFKTTADLQPIEGTVG